MMIRALMIVTLAASLSGLHATWSSADLPHQGAAKSGNDFPRDAFAVSLETAIEHFANPAVVFVDASREDEFSEGRIPGAINIPLTRFARGAVPEELDYFPKSSTVVVYCPTSKCDAARRVAQFMRAFGFELVFVFHDGLEAWRSANQPVER